METLISYNQEAVDFDEVINNGPFPIRFPKRSLSQDEEWCEVKFDGGWRKIRFHDYHEVYEIPGLYETIFYRTLRCNSPNRVAGLLDEVLTERGIDAQKLRVLDLGAGNGMSGEALQNLGIRKIVAIDLLEEAMSAALRDRPWVYDHYVVADLTKLSAQDEMHLREYRFNALCTIAALGFGDIPTQAFLNAFNLLEDGGMVAFNIKEDFLKRSTGNAFARLIDQMMQDEILEVDLLKRYQHRLSTGGHPLYYAGLVGFKRGNC